MRARYKALGEEIEPLQQIHQDLAAGEARLGQLRESVAEAQSLAEQLAALDHELSDQSYAPDERELLHKLAGEIELLGYSSAEHEALRQKLAELRPVEAEHARLQDAKSQTERLNSERAAAQNQLELADRQLAEARYAQAEREQLGQVEQQLAALGYDSAEHQRLRLQQDDLRDSARQFERLQNARARRASARESRVRYETEATAIEEHLQAAQKEQEKLHQRASELEGVDRQLGENQALLEKLRVERDQHLQRRGNLEALCARCAELAQERDELRQDLQGTQRQAWIYQQLDKAFGKDGIQALIIENAVPQIADEANAILARLTDNRIQIAFESLRDLKKRRHPRNPRRQDRRRDWRALLSPLFRGRGIPHQFRLAHRALQGAGHALGHPPAHALYRRGLWHPRRAGIGTTHRSHPKNQRGFQKGVDRHASRPT